MVERKNKPLGMFDEETDFIEEWGKLLEDDELTYDEEAYNRSVGK